MSTKTDQTAFDFLRSLVNTWSEEDCIVYLKSQSLSALREDCLASLEADFSDCETREDVEEVARMVFLVSPSTAPKRGESND
jgi:hypothetical protein